MHGPENRNPLLLIGSAWADPISLQISFLLFLVLLLKKPMFRRFKSDRDEIWQVCPSRKYTSIDGVGFWCDVILSRWRPWRHFTQKKSAAIWLFEEHRPNNNNNSKMSSDMGPVADQKDLVIRHAHDILSHATSRWRNIFIVQYKDKHAEPQSQIILPYIYCGYVVRLSCHDCSVW